MVSRTNIVGRRARNISRTGFTGGYKVIEYLPRFKGRKEHGVFKTKAQALKFKKELNIEIKKKTPLSSRRKPISVRKRGRIV